MLISLTAPRVLGKVARLAPSHRTTIVLAAGLLDAGLASLAGFIVALYAVLVLPPVLLGAYAIYYSAFVLGGFIPAMLYLLPARVAAVPLTQWNRVGILPSTLRTGALFGCAIAAVTPLAGMFALADVSPESLLPLAITSSALVILSPLQDHLRAVLHLSGRPRRAVVVSASHFVLAISFVGLLHIVAIAPQWVPMGALALANLCSLLVGLWLVRHDLRRYWIDVRPTGPVVKTGWSQLFVAILPIAAQLVVLGIVAAVVSVEVLGFIEAARVVGQPVHVAALGLEQANAPRILEAARTALKPAIWRARAAYVLPLCLACGVYLAVVGWPHAFNPAVHLMPTAYHLEALVLVSVLGVLVLDLGTVPRLELTGALRGGSLILPAVLGAAVQILLVVLLTSFVGAYVVPLALLSGSGLTTLLTFVRAQRLLAVAQH